MAEMQEQDVASVFMEMFDSEMSGFVEVGKKPDGTPVYVPAESDWLERCQAHGFSHDEAMRGALWLQDFGERLLGRKPKN